MRAGIAVASTLVMLLACQRRTDAAPENVAGVSPPQGDRGQSASISAELTTRPDGLPARSSGFEGWRGVKIQRGIRCRNCCDLVFPAEFGAKPDELRLLQEIVSSQDIEHDFPDCMMPRWEDALDQIKRLAIDHQDRAAAEVLTRAKSEGGLDLGGGELSETYAADYLIPTLLAYRRMSDILTPALEDHVATQVCAAAYGPATGEDIDVEAIVAQLQARSSSLAKRIKSTCKRIHEEFTK